MTSILFMKSISISFHRYLHSWFRTCNLDPIMFPTNQLEVSFLPWILFFLQSLLNNNSYVSPHFSCVMNYSCSLTSLIQGSLTNNKLHRIQHPSTSCASKPRTIPNPSTSFANSKAFHCCQCITITECILSLDWVSLT
jgi:hypothetical protein